METARANKAHPYYYLMYLLEKMPAHIDDTDHDQRILKLRKYLLV
ncbi:MAG: transposase domain-containing protein [Lachnospiraceae bacterium]|nr:transposase domain-containing protein [Lachnospiraceae bacterium]